MRSFDYTLRNSSPMPLMSLGRLASIAGCYPDTTCTVEMGSRTADISHPVKLARMGLRKGDAVTVSVVRGVYNVNAVYLIGYRSDKLECKLALSVSVRANVDHIFVFAKGLGAVFGKVGGYIASHIVQKHYGAGKALDKIPALV